MGPIIGLWERARQSSGSPGIRRQWRSYARDDQGYPALEKDAALVREFQPGFIPGLLQTGSYIRHIFRAARQPRSAAWVSEQCSMRLRRQQRLFEDEPVCLHAVVDETVLRRAVAPEIMLEQLSQLVERARLPNVTVQVVPHERGQYDGLDGSFTVLSYPDPEEADVAYVEHLFGSLRVEGADEVADCRRAFDYLAGLALGPDESVALIERVATIF